jgi:N4-(beta-N-acetylglucosaminyl)-L-asparaginase
MITRRDFVKSTTASLAAASVLPARAEGLEARSAEVLVQRTVRPVVISDYSGFEFKNGGRENAVERAFRLITEGRDVLDALIAGVNIPELDPLETGIGYGALPNANGVVELDASCMHGPTKRAGAVAGIEGVRTPSLVAKAVMDTPTITCWSARARRSSRGPWASRSRTTSTPRTRAGCGWNGSAASTRSAGSIRRAMGASRRTGTRRTRATTRGCARRAHVLHDLGWESRALAAGRSMVRDGLIREGSFWGTINCDGIGPNGDICGVTTTSGLAWKIPGRTGDSPILGAGLYVDNEVGAAGSTGRGEANLYNLSSFLIVEAMRRGMSPKDAGMEALKRIKANTVEKRLLNSKGNPNFNIRFFVLNKRGEYAGLAMYRAGETKYAVCTENGAQALELEPLLPGAPED